MKRGIGLVCVILAAVLAILLWIRVDILSSSYDNLYVHDITLDGAAFSMKIDTTSSAERFWDYEYAIKDGNLYITVYTGLFGGMTWPVSICITGPELESVERVYLRDGNRSKQIH